MAIAESRLTGVTQGGTSIASYAYDAQGRRKSRTVGSATTVYVTDADNRAVLEYDGTSGQVQRWYAYGLGLDEPLNQMNVPAMTRLTFVPDIQGSVLATLDSGSGLPTKAGYLPYGASGSAAGTFRYTGRRLDPETAGSAAEPSGLYDYRARIYSPALGRFLQPDPAGYAGGRNLYAYVGNDPLNQTDPLGLAADGPSGNGGGSSNQLIPTQATPTGTNSTSTPVQLASSGPSALQALGGGPTASSNGIVVTPQDLASLGLPAHNSTVSGIQMADIASDLEALGGGAPRSVPTAKGATQFIFPNGMILRFDLSPGQYLPGQGPHINLEPPGGGNRHIPLQP